MPDAVDVVAMLRRLDEAATKGPWSWANDGMDLHGTGDGVAGVQILGCDVYEVVNDANATLIATLRTLLPELIGVVEAAGRAAVAESYEAMSAAQDELSDRLDALAAAAEKVEVEGE